MSKGQQLTYNIVRNTVVIRKEQKIAPQTGNISMVIEDQIPPPIEVHGQVKDENGKPLLNASVVIKGTNKGTTTNANGKFNITVPNNKAVLVISYTGYKTKEILIGSQTSIDIQLTRTDNSLNEVVVTALGIKRQAKSLGYSATSVNTNEVNTAGVVNFGNNLVGKVAGVNVNVLGSGAGGTAKIRIRGQSSFGANNSPLIVINGIPVNNEPITSGNPNAQESDLGDALQSINPNDIESMTVLKGASAAALYGFRAKDGVIIITTKSGAQAKGLGIEFRTSYTAVPGS